MNNILINNIYTIQEEYLQLLEKLVLQISDANKISMLDELQVFWFEKYYIIELYLSYYSVNTYVFTGATYIDVDDQDYYPFMLLGKQHIFDDPIMNYSYIARKRKGIAPKLFLEQILKSAKDTINVLKNRECHILVFPMRWINSKWGITSKEMKKLVDSAIVSMFDNSVNSIEDLFQYCDTIKSIQCRLKVNLSLGTRDIGLPLEEKLNRAWGQSKSYLDQFSATDIMKFYMLVYGLISQSLEIIFFSSKYLVVPYIRNFSTFFYFSRLARNIEDSTSWDIIIRKATVSFLLHEQFDKSIFKNISFDRYLEILTDNSFEQSVLEKTADIPPEKLSLILKVIKNELSIIYKTI